MDITTVLIVLISTLLGMGTQLVMTHDEKKEYKDIQRTIRQKGLSSSKLAAIVERVLNDIAKKNTTVYNAAVRQVNAIPVVAASGGLQNFLRAARGKANDNLNAAEERLNNSNKQSADVRAKVGAYDMTTDEYKAQYGEKDVDDIIQDTRNLAIENGVDSSNLSRDTIASDVDQKIVQSGTSQPEINVSTRH